MTEGILRAVLEAVQKADARRVERIDLEIGELTRAADDSVQFYFDFLSRGTIAEGASLRFHRRQPMATCQDCGYSCAADVPLVPECPECGGNNLRISGGTELHVKSIEISDEDPGGQTDDGRERPGGGTDG